MLRRPTASSSMTMVFSSEGERRKSSDVIKGTSADGDAGLVEAGGFDQQSQAHQEVVVTVRRIDEKVQGLAGAVEAFGAFHLQPEFLVFGRIIGGVHFEPARVDGGQQIKAEPGFSRRGKGERNDARAQVLPEKRSDGLTNAGGIDYDAAAVPDVLKKVDHLGIEFGVPDAGPGVVLDDFESGQFTVFSTQSGEKRGSGGRVLRWKRRMKRRSKSRRTRLRGEVQMG